jgi:hypothetical protein
MEMDGGEQLERRLSLFDSGDTEEEEYDVFMNVNHVHIVRLSNVNTRVQRV